MKPMILIIYRKAKSSITYVGLSSNKHIYARRIKGEECYGWPMYMRIKRSLTKPTNTKCFYDDKHYLHVRELFTDSDTPMEFSKTFSDFEEDDNCKLQDIDEIIKTGFYKNIPMIKDN